MVRITGVTNSSLSNTPLFNDIWCITGIWVNDKSIPVNTVTIMLVLLWAQTWQSVSECTQDNGFQELIAC